MAKKAIEVTALKHDAKPRGETSPRPNSNG